MHSIQPMGRVVPKPSLRLNWLQMLLLLLLLLLMMMMMMTILLC